MTGRRVTPEGILIARYDTPRGQWLDFRKEGIGGSDALAVLGLDRWKSRMEVYLDKTGDTRAERQQTDVMAWGNYAEGPIAEWFTFKTGIGVRRCGLMANADRPWQRVSVDRLTADGGLLECKNTNYHRREEWSGEDGDTVADGAEAQSQHGLAVTGLPHAWVAAQVGGEPPVIRRVDRDDALIADMTAVEAEFWQLVLDRTPPALEGRASPDLVRRLFPGAVSGKVIEIGADALAILRDARRAQQDESAAKRSKEELSARVQMLAGDAEIITCGGRVVATWKNGDGRRSADLDLMAREFPAAYAAAVSRKPGRRFLNKLKDSDVLAGTEIAREAA
jgi:putative phage-type endonuclease